jgi:hypothetical protein
MTSSSSRPCPLGPHGSRRATVRWSDGTEGEALRWYTDEILVCEGDLLGKTAEELRALKFGATPPASARRSERRE